MTTILALDTSTRMASVAVCDDSGTRVEVARESRGANLLLLVDEACRQADLMAASFAGRGLSPASSTPEWECGSIDAIAIGSGPGSFTGLRIGMATAKGIAYAARRPLWIVSSLAALAYGSNTHGVVVAVLDARRGELFAGAFRRDDRGVVALGDERVLAPTDLAAFAATMSRGEEVRFIGDAATVHPELGALPGEWSRTPRAQDVARLVLAGDRRDALATAVPSYVRRADAEIMYPDGIPGALRS